MSSLRSTCSSDGASGVAEDDRANLIQVYVRVRAPANRSEPRCLEMDDHGVLVLSAPAGKKESFEFDRVGAEGASQEEVFNEAAKPIADACLAGFNGTVLCYGQTGAGKTYTMCGPPPHLSEGTSRGLLARVVDHLFASIAGQMHGKTDLTVASVGRFEADVESQSSRENADRELVEYTVTCSFLEIYNEVITDLLCGSSDTGENLSIIRNSHSTPKKPHGLPGRSGDLTHAAPSAPLRLREDADRGIHVANLTRLPVENAKDAMNALAIGLANRAVGATAMNQHSSRSHAVFSLQLQQCRKLASGKQLVRTSQLHLVDLAGSERAKETGASGTRLKESCKINCSLSVLSKVITQLVESRGAGMGKSGSQSMPSSSIIVSYRESKLTHLLRDSLGGDSRTCIIANVTSAERAHSETLSTLKFAARAKAVRTRAVQQKLIQLEDSGQAAASQEWWQADAGGDTRPLANLTPENALATKRYTSGQDPIVAKLEADRAALQLALQRAESRMRETASEAEIARERHRSELMKAESTCAAAEEALKAQRTQIEEERAQEAKAAEKRARLEAEEQADRAASVAKVVSQRSANEDALRQQLQDLQAELETERQRSTRLRGDFARIEAERDGIRRQVIQQQRVIDDHAAQMSSLAQQHAETLRHTQRCHVRAVAALEEVLRRSGKGGEADAVRRELRRLEAIAASTTSMEAMPDSSGTAKHREARSRTSDQRRGNRKDNPSWRTPLSPAKSNHVNNRWQAAASSGKLGKLTSGSRSATSLSEPSMSQSKPSTRQDPATVARILELGGLGVSVSEINATLIAEDHCCSSGAPWGRNQADGRVIVRLLLQNGLSPIIINDDKLDGFAQDYARRLQSNDMPSNQSAADPSFHLAGGSSQTEHERSTSTRTALSGWTTLAPPPMTPLSTKDRYTSI